MVGGCGVGKKGGDLKQSLSCLLQGEQAKGHRLTSLCTA